MDVWHFSEMAYHPAWDELGYSLRNDIPSRAYDPKVGADLYHRYFDEWMLADELGLNIMVNEHHASATCVDAICSVTLAILARITTKARLLALGMPIGNRFDAVRAAEEYAMIDVISRGRVEMGFVRGSPLEIAPANANPTNQMERFWEAHDLILKAMTTQDGPFNWEGNHFHYRQVNVWPRPYQTPHPPIWIPGGSPSTAKAAAERGYVLATLNTGYARTGPLFDAYRKHAAEAKRQVTPDRLAYLGMVGVGETKEEGLRRASLIADYARTTPRANIQDFNPPGYNPPTISARLLSADPGSAPLGQLFSVESRDGKSIDPSGASIEDFIDAGLAFGGDPDMVFEQIKEFHDHVGGFGHLLMMGQGGYLNHEDTVSNLTLFAKEVMPRLKELHS